MTLQGPLPSPGEGFCMSEHKISKTTPCTVEMGLNSLHFSPLRDRAHEMLSRRGKGGVLFGSDPDYLAAAAAVSPGGKIRNMDVETFSPGLNGPGIWLLTGFKLWRKAAIARASSAVSDAKACHGMIGARRRPSGRSPACIAFTICSRVQLPMPVFLSGVMFGPTKTP